MKTRTIRWISGWVLSALLSAVTARAGTVTIGDYAALTNAIAVCADGDTISLTTNITVNAQLSITMKGLTFEGNHHTISVPVPSLEESGVLHHGNPSSAFRVFNFTTGNKTTNTLRNLTVKGGSPNGDGGGILNSGGVLVLEGVTVTQSGGSDYGGGGIANNSGTLFMRDCMISRNIARDGGGFHNFGTGAKTFVERCTLSDNRCMSGWGGGAVENGSGASLYANNSTFAANECNELGGAVNNAGGIAYFVGCTFVGNMASGSHEGGAIAHNNGGVTLVNSLFAYNYHLSGGTYLLNDITNYSGTPPVAYGCVFQSTTNQLGASSFGTHLYTGNATGSDDTLFSGGTEARVLQVNGMEEGAGTFYQPVLWKSGVEQTATTAMKNGGFAVGKGVRAAFSSATATPVVGYFNGSAWVTLSGSNPASHEVTTDQNGVDRAGLLIVGAAVSNVIGLYRLKVTASDGGTVLGGTIYGDTYPGNTLVMLTAIPFPGYKFSAWDYVLGGSGVASSANPFAVTLTTNVTVLPVFVPSAPAISVPPTNQVLATGNTLVLSVSSKSVGTQHYQWFKNGGMVSGATNRILTRAGAAVTDTGIYTVAITNAYGMSISTPVTVTVGTPQLLACGNNNSGQLGDGTTAIRSHAVSVASNVVVAAAGQSHSLFVKSDGTLWAIGYNNYGQLGDGTMITRSLPVPVDSNVVTVAGGAKHTLFLKQDGTLWAMGYNNRGQLGDGTVNVRSNAVPVASNVVAIAAGADHSLFLKNDGTLWAMGRNSNGQLGDGTTADKHAPESVASNVVAIAAGMGYSLFLKNDGKLWAMGYNDSGQLGDGTTADKHSPVSVASNVLAIAAGVGHSFYLKNDDTLWAMGQNNDGELGDGTQIQRNRPVFVASNVLAMATGEWHSLFLKGDGTLWAMGNNDSGQLGDGTMIRRITPVSVPGLSLASIVSGNGATHTLAVGEPLAPVITTAPTRQVLSIGGTLALSVTALSVGVTHYQWFKNGGMVSGETNSTLTRSGAAMTDSGSYYVAITNAYGVRISTPVTVTVGTPQLLAWGQNSDGQLGDGTTITRSNAVSVANNVVAASAGFRHSLYVMGDGTLWAMGFNWYGPLGDGTQIQRSSPVPVASNVVAVAAGLWHSLFLKGDGTLWAMGDNIAGELGDGTTINRSTPVSVASHVVYIAAGSGHSLFLKDDATLWAMGNNNCGQLGDGTTTERSNAVCVASNVVSMAAGSAHSLFLKRDGTLWAMGDNTDGQLGDGTYTSFRSNAVCVASTVTALAAGVYHSLFLKGDGTLCGMGGNYTGELGYGYTSLWHSPITIASNVTDMAAGYYHSLFLKGDGTMWAMGDNTYGQLGDGTMTDTYWPVAVAGMSLTSVRSGSSAYHTFAIGVPLPLTITGEPLSQIVEAGSNVTFTVAANGFEPLSYQWYFNNVVVSGATTTNYILPNVTVANAGNYTVVVSNPESSVTSGVAMLIVIERPIITTAPTSQVLAAGGTVNLNGTVTGVAPLAYQWFKNGGMVSGATNSTLTQSNAAVIDSGIYYLAITNAFGMSISAPVTVTVGTPQLLAWGQNLYGQLGDGTTNNRSQAVSVAGNVVVGAAGYQHTVFVKGDSTLWAMGANDHGQLGDGTVTSQHTPVFVASNVVAGTAGYQHTLFVKGDSTLWAMGQNGAGELGDGTTAGRHAPVSVATQVVAVAAGCGHSLFLKGDGTLWAMGQNTYGQLGDGTTVSRSRAVFVASNVVAIAAGFHHSLFLKGDGTLWAAGYNTYGQLGDGTMTDQHTPVSVASNVSALAAGAWHSLFLQGDGSLWAMGENNRGQLGDGSTDNRSNAVFVASTVTALTAGQYHSLFVKGDGTLWAMGDNEYGQLGDGTTTHRYRPVSLIGMSLAAMVSGSTAYHTLAVGEPSPPVITISPATQTATGGSNVIFTVAASGIAPLTYQWYFNDAAIREATATNYTLTGVTAPNAGNYTVVVSNFGGSVTSGVAVLTFVKGLASVTLDGLIQTHDGTPKRVTAITVPADLTVLMTYNGFATAPTAVGTYAVTGTVSDVNWQGSASGTLTIKASQSISFPALAPQPLAVTVRLVATASSGLPVSFNVLSGPGTITGNTNLTFSAAGLVVVVASQAGDAIYGEAPNVTNLVFVCTVIPDNGPFVGGNTVTINSGAPGTIANVFVGGVEAEIQSIDTNGLTLIMTAIGSAGIKDIVVHTSDNGDFTLSNAYTVNPAGSIGTSRVEPSGWEGLGSGLSGSSVSALALDGTNIYVGGDFTTAGGVTANRVALWNASGWTNLGSGLAGTAVYALVHDGANLYAGGDFTNAGGVVVNAVAMWNGTVWTNLSSGMNGSVRALALDGQNLYAGGTFTTAGGVAANYVAMWNGTVWTNLDSGVDSWVRALAHDGTNLVAGGYFATAGAVEANHVAQWDGTSWKALGSGLNNDVRALTILGTNLVAGGDFTTAGEEAANAVALWNGTFWEALGSGMNDSVTSLAKDGVNLYAGGFFTEAGNSGANYVAMWDGAGWTALGSGMNNAVKALVHDGVDLVAGGDFTVAGDMTVNRVGVWGQTLVSLSGVEPRSGALTGGYTVTINGANLCNGSDAVSVTLCGVEAFIQSQSATQIVVTAGTAVTTGLGDVRIYSTRFGETMKTNAFTYLADQTVSFAAIAPQPRAATVRLAATASSGLPVTFRVVSGPGTITDNTNLTFSAAGMVVVAASQAGDAFCGAAPDVIKSIYVYTVIPDNGPFAGGNSVTIYSGYTGMITNVYVGGVAATIQGIDTNRLTLTMPATGSDGIKDIRVQTSAYGDFTLSGAYTVNPAGQIGGTTPGPNVWTGRGEELSGSFILALVSAGTNLYAGGSFTIPGAVDAAVAAWCGANWSALGEGPDDTVTALAYDGTYLYAGGYFTTAGGVQANYVARWDGMNWSSLGSGMDDSVSALVCAGGKLYAGGSFTTSGENAANGVAMWNGTSWEGLGSGIVGSSVTALAHDGTNLYAAGYCTMSGGVAANRVVMWNGASWTNLGSSMNDAVYSLTWSGTYLYAGGDFTTVGGRAANRVARWDGSEWTSLGSGLNDTVRALVYAGSNLYAGGAFTTAGGAEANRVARWDGSCWSSLGSGMEKTVRALAHDGTNLYVGGVFAAVDGSTIRNVAIWQPTVITHVSVTPSSVPSVGGYQVVISGVNLCNGSDVTNVTLCGISASVLSQSATQIVVTAGAAILSGIGDVRVYSAGYGETVRADAFTYTPLIWNPQVQGGGGFGVRSNQFGFTISGPTNLVVIIEACTNLSNPVWIPLETNTLTDGVFYFSDPAWTNYPSRFYRLLQP